MSKSRFFKHLFRPSSEAEWSMANARAKKRKKPTNTVACFWNEGPFADILRQNKVEVFTSDSDIEQLYYNTYDLILVLAELRPTEGRLSDFHGMRILKKLRMEYRLLGPIVVCSFLSRAFFSPPCERASLVNELAVLECIDSLTQSFMPLPFTPSDLKARAFRSYSEEELDQVLERIGVLQGPDKVITLLVDHTTLVDSLTDLVRSLASNPEQSAALFYPADRVTFAVIRNCLRMSAICLAKAGDVLGFIPRPQQQALIDILDRDSDVDVVLNTLMTLAEDEERRNEWLKNNNHRVNRSLSSFESILTALNLVLEQQEMRRRKNVLTNHISH